MAKNKIQAILLIFSAIALIATCFIMPESAYAVTTGDNTEISGWVPTDIVQSDINLSVEDANDVAPKLESILIELIRFVIPILCIACVAMIVYNAIANIFRKPEKRVKMSGLIKNMFMGFFWILFAWIIVELIVWAVTGGETLAYGLLFG